MRKIIIVTLLSLAFTSANANIIFSDDFDSEAPGSGSILNYGSDTNPSFANWTVSNGTVDLIANVNQWGISCAGNSGKCVDLDGSSNNAGKLTSTYFTLAAGNYILSFDISGNQRNSEKDRLNFSLEGFVNKTIKLKGTKDFRTLSYFFTVGTSDLNSIVFNHKGNDNIGMILDNVSVTDVNAPGTLAFLGLGLTGLAVRRRKQKSI
jgi:uncharacterized protein (TIGR03382 family)